jgi:hypothetical protein
LFGPHQKQQNKDVEDMSSRSLGVLNSKFDQNLKLRQFFGTFLCIQREPGKSSALDDWDLHICDLVREVPLIVCVKV